MNVRARFLDTPTKAEFIKTLRKRVNDYFKENGVSRNANATMVTKTIAMLLIYFIPYLLILSNWFNPWVLIGLAIIMGIGKAGIGMSVMHDALHGSYSKNPTINKLVGSSINIIGGNASNWSIQHNVLHHTYTNVDGIDGDLDAGTILRFSPHQKKRFFHRFQHIYAFFFYGFLTMSWSLPKDFIQLRRYHKMGLKTGKQANMAADLSWLIASKLFYFLFIVIIPLLVMNHPWWYVPIGFFIMHFTAGFILSVVFQLAHVVEKADYPLPNDEGNIENSWAIHQLFTTANFSKNNWLISWYVGGLNFQIEHHLFPSICHVHYKKLSDIVKSTAREFDLPYMENKTIWNALGSHIRWLKALGQGQSIPA